MESNEPTPNTQEPHIQEENTTATSSENNESEEKSNNNAVVQRILASKNVIESTLDFFEGPFPTWLQAANLYDGSKQLYSSIKETSIGHSVAPSLESLAETLVKKLAEIALPGNVQVVEEEEGEGEEKSEEIAEQQLRYLSALDQFVLDLLTRFDSVVEAGKDDMIQGARNATSVIVEKAVEGTERAEVLLAQLVETLNSHIQRGLEMIAEVREAHPEISERISQYLSFVQSLIPQNLKTLTSK